MPDQKYNCFMVLICHLDQFFFSFSWFFENVQFFEHCFAAKYQTLKAARADHDKQQDHHQCRIQKQSKIIKINIVSKISHQLRAVKKQNGNAHKSQYQFVYHRHRHKHHAAVRYFMPFFLHVIKLHRLSACCRRCDTGIKKSHKRIFDAGKKRGFPLQTAKKIPDHNAFRGCKEQSRKSCSHQINRA